MERRVPRIEVRIGESILASAESTDYRIGTAPEVAFAIEGMTAFPLVAGRVVRRPLGMGVLRIDGEVADVNEVTLVPGMRVELSLQLVTFAIDLVERRAWVARPLLDRRLPMYVAWLLLGHAVFAGVALGVSRPLPAKKQLPKLVAHPVVAALKIAVPKPPPVPAPRTSSRSGHGSMQRGEAHDVTTATTASKFAGYNHLSAGAREALGGLGSMDTSELLAATDIDMVRQALIESTPYDPDSTYDGFGGKAELALRDPRTDPDAYKIIAAQRYMTISSVGTHSEADELRVNIALCDSRRCEVAGALPKEALQAAIHHVGAALVTCTKDQAVYVDLTIAADGSVRAKGKGKAAACAARVIEQRVAFPVSSGITTAKFTIGYPET